MSASQIVGLIMLSTALSHLAYGQTSTIPYADSFEGYTGGTSLVSMDGWDGATAIVTTNSYVYAFEYPFNTDHAQVLTVDGAVSNLFGNTSEHTNVWVDFMWRVEPGDEPVSVGEAPFSLLSASPNEIQLGLYLNTNGHLMVRHRYYNLSFSALLEGWTELNHSPLTSGEWVRITINLDYLSDCFGDKYFYICVNGSDPITNVLAYDSWYNCVDDPLRGGHLFLCAHSGDGAGESQFVGLGTCGYGCLDDLVVSTSLTTGALFHTIVAMAGDNGTVTPDGRITLADGEATNVIVNADPGYYIVDVLVDGQSAGIFGPGSNTFNRVFSNVTNSHMISASFASTPIDHTITASASSNGTITPSGAIEAEDGGVTNFVIQADSGYHIASILVDGEPAGTFGPGSNMFEYVFVNITNNHTISASFAATPPSEITLLSPNGSEINDDAWLIGCPYEITWEHTTNVTGTLKIEYAADVHLGTNWEEIATGVDVAAGSWPWTTPGLESDYCLVRIMHETNFIHRDTSDSPFHLVKRYLVIEHNGGGAWYVGETNIVKWGSAQGLGMARICFLPDNIESNEALIEELAISNGGSMTNTYDWFVSHPVTNINLMSETGRLRITTPGGGYGDTSDDTFVMAGVMFLNPSLGSELNNDAQHSVEWMSAGCGPVVKIEYQSNPTNEWTLLDGSVSNVVGHNTYDWYVTNQPTSTARLRVISVSEPRARGISHEFTVGGVEIDEPDSAAVYGVGRTNPVTFVAAGTHADPMIANIYYASNGVSFDTNNPVATNVAFSETYPCSTTYNWVIEPTRERSFYARIKVEAGSYDAVSEPFSVLDLVDHDVPVYWLEEHDLGTNSVDIDGDDDNDGCPNWQEYFAGTDPTNKGSVFAVTNVNISSDSEMVIQWYSVANKVYAIKGCTNLLSGGWFTLSNNISATHPLNTATVKLSNPITCFSRIQIEH